MNDISTRVRNYLDSKKARQPESVTNDVKVEIDEDENLCRAWAEFKSEWSKPFLIIKTVGIVVGVLTVMWAIAIVDIQNDCWLNKECREWVEKNR